MGEVNRVDKLGTSIERIGMVRRWFIKSLSKSETDRISHLVVQLDEEDGDTSKRGKKWRMSREVDNVNRMNCTGTITKVEGDLMYRWEIVCRMM